MLTMLSLAPLASCVPSPRQVSPQTSLVWLNSSATLWLCTRTSWFQIDPSLHPELTICLSHANTPTRAAWPDMVRILVLVSTSQTCVSPSKVPIASDDPSNAHDTDV